MTEDLQSFLSDENQKRQKIAALGWSCRLPTKLPFLYIESGTGLYFRDTDSDDKPYKMVLGLFLTNL